MSDRTKALEEQAREARNAGDLTRAGHLYTAAAHTHAGSKQKYAVIDPLSTTSAVSRFCFAATCYRIAGDEFHVQNRCEIGTLLAEDQLNYVNDQEFEAGSYEDLRRGAWHEFIGDLRTIAKRDDAETAYEKARNIYTNAGEWDFSAQEGEHITLASYIRALRDGAGHDVPDDSVEYNILGYTFTEWLESKRKRLPDLLTQLEERGEWPTE